MTIVTERWYGQGADKAGLNTRYRVHPTCLMVVGVGITCGKPATARANLIDLDPHPRYPSDWYWCPEHAEMLMTDRSGW